MIVHLSPAFELIWMKKNVLATNKPDNYLSAGSFSAKFTAMIT